MILLSIFLISVFTKIFLFTHLTVFDYHDDTALFWTESAEAMALATNACELTNFKEAEALDTLAAAYAEQGNFRKAIEYQHRAIELVLQQIKKDLQKRLQLYKLRHAHRDK